ncbi:MAG TPA: efflux transporter outer membrane subunit [Burkholderiales bacterium]|nr:efflux transporter outer membrane subunit [Burkholderiales bacterium]
MPAKAGGVVGAAIAVALSLTACTVGPDYVRPEVDTPQAFRFEEKEAKDLANTAWWKQFRDPVLDALIDEGLANSKDLRIAAARVEEFAGRLTTTRSQFYPQIGYGGGGAREQFSERLGTSLPPGVSNPQTTYSAVITASWEIDLFGRIRRLSEAAQAQLMATEEGRRGVVLSLVSSVATGYIALRGFDKQLEIAKRTAASRRAALDLFELRYKGGVVSLVEVAQIRSEYEAAVAAIPTIERAIAQTENALSILVGRNPGPIVRGKSIDELQDVAVPAGVPSDLLVRRPDIRQAEQNLVAANANIGAARALYYPTISLTGLFGYASSDLDNLFSGPSQQWSYGGSIIGPIFTFGLIEGLVAASEAQQRQLLANYESTIQNAFREVDDSLIDNRKSRERLAAQSRQVAALRDYARLSRMRFEGGVTSYLEVLDAERSLFNTELDYTQTQGEVFNALVNIYKSMGGGWVNEADKLAPQPRIEAESTQ